MALDHILAIAGLVGTLISLALAVYFYLQSQRKIQLSYQTEHTQLLGGTASALPEEVTISYEKTEIKNLRKINFLLWNSGSEPIRESDVASESLAILHFPDEARLLKASILKVSSASNLVTIWHGNGDSLKIRARFLEPRQGCNIEILYTGEQVMPHIHCIIIGMAGGLRAYNEKTTGVIPRKVGVPIGFGVGLAILAGLWFAVRPVEALDYVQVIFVAFTIGFVGYSSIAAVWQKWKRRIEGPPADLAT